MKSLQLIVKLGLIFLASVSFGRDLAEVSLNPTHRDMSVALSDAATDADPDAATDADPDAATDAAPGSVTDTEWARINPLEDPNTPEVIIRTEYKILAGMIAVLVFVKKFSPLGLLTSIGSTSVYADRVPLDCKSLGDFLQSQKISNIEMSRNVSFNGIDCKLDPLYFNPNDAR